MRLSKRARNEQPEPAILVADAQIRLVDISRSGCLIESRRHVAPGTTGELRVDVGGQTLSEQVRITRCVRVEGSGSLYRVGVEFLRTRQFDQSSLRRAVYGIRERAGGAFVNGTRLVPVD
jgi:c-di-GMP-binding flagellar brake protein YcgR